MNPRIIRPAGTVTHAQFVTSAPSFTTMPQRYTKAQKDGLRYEKRVQGYLHQLVDRYGRGELILNPWLLYHTRSGGPTAVNFCQPDCLFVDGSRVIIVECKLQHTNESWQQLRLVYEPVLRKAFSHSMEFALVEVCKWYDPHKYYAESFYYCENVLEAEIGKLGIHIYKPRGRSS